MELGHTEQNGPFRLVRPDADWAMRGLRVLVGGPERAPALPLVGGTAKVPEIDLRIEGFLSYAHSISLDITRQVLALHPGEAGVDVIAGMCLWVPSPGRTAMLFSPSLSEFPESAPATEAAIRGALEDARTRGGVVLVQAMMEPADAAGKTVFAGAGLSQLATLTYMERQPPIHPPNADSYALPPGHELRPYSAETHGLFAEAILRSYEQTLDCSALSGMRDINDIIAGHQAVGPFDPQLWGVLVRFGKPEGCLLLGEIPARHGLELVYLGLAPEARGHGLGRMLMQRVLAIASRRHFEVATLAVDASNAPAVRLYRRCGYISVAQRVAMIRKLP